MPGQALLVELLHEWVGVELLDVPYARLLPDAFQQHHGADHGWHARGVADALHARLVVGILVLAVVIYIIGVLLAVLLATDAATDGSLAVVVLAEVLGVGQHGLQELQRNDLHLGGLAGAVRQRSLVLYFVDAAHAEVLDAVEIGEVLLAEGHPEASLLDGGVVLHQALQLLVVHQVALARADVGVGERPVDSQRIGLDPFAVLVPESLLGDLADVDLWVEVGGESLVVVAGVAVHDVEGLDLVEVVLGGVCREDAGHTRVETATEDGAEACLLELVLVSPLPRVLEVSLVLRLVVGGVHVVASACQASVHDGEVLVRQGEVDDQLWLVAVEERLQLLHVVGVDLCRLDIHLVTFVVDGSHQFVALLLATAGNHEFGENVLVLDNLEGCHGSYATCANHKYSTHFVFLMLSVEC